MMGLAKELQKRGSYGTENELPKRLALSIGRAKGPIGSLVDKQRALQMDC